jgi:hypothetical protein
MYEELDAKLSQIQVKLFDDDIEERESEALNIEYEKLIQELESKKEYIEERNTFNNFWNQENQDINKYILV